MVFSFDVLLSRLQEAKVLKKMRIEDISKKSNSEKECNIIKKYRQLTAEQQGAIENNIDYFIQVNNGKRRRPVRKQGRVIYVDFWNNN